MIASDADACRSRPVRCAIRRIRSDAKARARDCWSRNKILMTRCFRRARISEPAITPTMVIRPWQDPSEIPLQPVDAGKSMPRACLGSSDHRPGISHTMIRGATSFELAWSAVGCPSVQSRLVAPSQGDRSAHEKGHQVAISCRGECCRAPADKVGHSVARGALMLWPCVRFDPIVCDGLRSCATPHGRQVVLRAPVELQSMRCAENLAG